MEILFGLVGGLSLFLMGMNMMSEGLQKVAGQRMKKVLQMLTVNRVVGVLAGALVTAVLQSSSATTVLVIGFVSSGLMTLPQGISIIFGANIGTTMTAQLLAFKISDYIMLFVAVGFFMWFAFKNETVKNVGQTIFAFGLLFVGIETMGDVMKPLASSDVFLNMISYVKDIPALGVCVGALMTVVVQSSSATIAVLQNFASQAGADGQSVIGIEGAIPILLGDNIGTTITALLACIGQSRDAKRVAVSHATFNVLGALIFIWFVPLLAAWVQFLSPGNEVDVISRQIANAHTTYNVLNTLIWLPLLPLMVKIVCFIVPDKGESAGALVTLDNRIVGQPVFAINMLREQLQKYCVKVGEIIDQLHEAIEAKDSKLLVSVQEDTAKVQGAQESLNEFMVDLFAAGVVTEDQAEEASDLMLLTDSVGNINDRCAEAAEVYANKLKVKEDKQFSSDAVHDLAESVAMLSSMYQSTLVHLGSEDDADLEELERRRRKTIKRQSKVRKNHFQRITNKECLASNRDDFDSMLLSIERASNECFNLVEHGVGLRLLKAADEEVSAETLAALEAADEEAAAEKKSKKKQKKQKNKDKQVQA